MAGFKTIAIPPNPGARRGVRLSAARDIDVGSGRDPVAVAIRPPIAAVRVQPAHRYRIGERLAYVQWRLFGWPAPARSAR